jgi:hypothetical protein
MKRIVFVFGAIAGVVVTGQMLYSVSQCYNNPNWQPNDILGYTGMIIAFSMIFVGIKTYRDKHLGGTITFGKAFLAGLYIVLIASAVYVVTWLVDYYVFVPDFIDRYAEHCMREAARDGGNPDKTAADIAQLKEMYKSPLFVTIITFMEVFPVGLIIALISALILRRKSPEGETTLNQTA